MAIEKFNLIKRETLSSEFYFQSLMEQATLKALLSDQELEKIQLDCLNLLAQKTERYNHGDSSSVMVEVAQSLMASLLFTLGVYLKTYLSPDEALEAIKAQGIANLYQKGYDMIEKRLKLTKKLHAIIGENLMTTENVFYHSTAIEGIKGFFKLYRPELLAQEIHITADYPVHHTIEPLGGIEFIQKYLECIYFENLFCTQFETEDIHQLLSGYHNNYKELLFNIYEVLLTVALGCILSGRAVRSLDLSPLAVHLLEDQFEGKNSAELLEILKEGADQLGQLFALTDGLRGYIRGSLHPIAVAIENAMSLKTLNRVFVFKNNADEEIPFIFTDGAKMDDENYRKLLSELENCRYLTDKVALIKREVKSLGDLEDIFSDANFDEEEIISLLEALSPTEIAALMKKHLFLDGPHGFTMNDETTLLSQCLQKLLISLPIKQQEIVQSTVNRLVIRN